MLEKSQSLKENTIVKDYSPVKICRRIMYVFVPQDLRTSPKETGIRDQEEYAFIKG